MAYWSRSVYPHLARGAGFLCFTVVFVFRRMCGWRMVRYACVRACGALPPQPLAAFASPRGKGLRAPPSDSHPRQAELAGCLLRAARACALRAVFFWGRARCGTSVCAVVAGSCRGRSLRSRLPEGGASRPYPRTPSRGKLSLQAVFCALRARVRFAQVSFVLAHGATRLAVPTHAAARRGALLQGMSCRMSCRTMSPVSCRESGQMRSRLSRSVCHQPPCWKRAMRLRVATPASA